MEVTVLGCAGGYPSPGNPASGYLVRDGSDALWVDAGSGTFAELQRHLAPADLTGVVLTHRHADHCTDLIGLFVHLKYDIGRTGLPVMAPPDTRSLLEPFAGFGFGATFEWDEVDDGDTRVLGDVEFTFSRTDHPVPTVALDIAAAGRRVVYTSDTGPRWSVSSFAPGADLVISEATYNSKAMGAALHLTRGAGRCSRPRRRCPSPDDHPPVADRRPRVVGGRGVRRVRRRRRTGVSREHHRDIVVS